MARLKSGEDIVTLPRLEASWWQGGLGAISLRSLPKNW